jgi:hypothetical protein
MLGAVPAPVPKDACNTQKTGKPVGKPTSSPMALPTTAHTSMPTSNKITHYYAD